MIRDLKRKFVIVSTLSVFAILLIFVVGLNVSNYREMDSKTNQIISFIEESKGRIPRPDKIGKQPLSWNNFSREEMMDPRFFVVYYDEGGQILSTSLGYIKTMTPEDAKLYAEKIIESEKTEGYYNDYKFRCTEIEGKKAIIFIECSRDIQWNRRFLYNSIFASIGALILVAVLSYFLSGPFIKPIARANQKQKAFITNASHELKTPLTVISANADVIEMTSGENKWTKSTKDQIGRMTGLINSMVALSKMEEDEKLEKREFSISELAEDLVENYNTIAISKERTLVYSIQPDVKYVGDEESINRLFYIIMDNAFKYSSVQSEINLNLFKKKDKVYINLTNKVDEIEPGNHGEFFDRFYRSDPSRNTKIKGFGIGLSLAESIVKKHKGKITAKSPDNKTLVIEIIL